MGYNPLQAQYNKSQGLAGAHGQPQKVDHSKPNAGNNFWGHGSHANWFKAHQAANGVKPGPTPAGGCKGGCGGGTSNPMMTALQAQLDAQLASLESGELAFQKYLDQAEKDRAVTMAAQKKIDDGLAARQAEEDAITQERKDRAIRGRRDLIRYIDDEEEDSTMLALGGQL